MNNPTLLIIYTGGTIGMVNDPQTGVLAPANFKELYRYIPSLSAFKMNLDTISFDPVIDSSDMNPDFWINLAGIIEENYDKYNGFVVLHGSDTMAYTASALSFMLENLAKPVILTGSQLPLGMPRTDGRENFITAVDIAAACINNKPIIAEVAIYFEYRLYKGNRTTKLHAEDFEAFYSGNYPVLAEAGVHIRYNHNAINTPVEQHPLHVQKKLDNNIAILKLFPGISKNAVEAVFNINRLKGVILETFGTGNAPTDKWFLDIMRDAIKKEIIIFNVTQCKAGSVEAGRYKTSEALREMGVVSGYDITTESAIAKMMYLFGKEQDHKKIKKLLQIPLQGEMTVASVVK